MRLSDCRIVAAQGTPTRPAGAMTHRWPRFIGAALTVIVGVWAGARVYSRRDAAPDLPAAALVAAAKPGATTRGELAPSLAAAMPHGSKIPDRLPEFSLQGRDGKPVSIKAWAGKSLVINFWATWCAPCRREIPLLESLQHAWADRGVAVIGIAVDHRDQVLAYADELKIAYPLLIGEQDALDAAAAFGVASPAFPFTVFTDRRGEVVALYIGELHKAADGSDSVGTCNSSIRTRFALPRRPACHRTGTAALDQRHPVRAFSGDVRRRSLPIRVNFWLISRTFSARQRWINAQMARILLLNGPNLNLLGTARAGDVRFGDASRHRIKANRPGPRQGS